MNWIELKPITLIMGIYTRKCEFSQDEEIH